MSDPINNVRNKNKNTKATKPVAKTEPGVVSSKSSVVIEGKYLSSDEYSFGIPLNFEKFDELHAFCKKGNLIVPIQVPENSVSPRFNIADIKKPSRPHMSAINKRKTPKEKRKCVAIEAKFQPFDSLNLEIFEIGSPKCREFIEIYEMGDVTVPIRVPENYGTPSFKIEDLTKLSRRFIPTIIGEKKKGNIEYVLVLSGTIAHAMDSYILETGIGNFIEITAQVVAVALKHPYQPISKDNELCFLIRGCEGYGIVMQVFVEYGRKAPYIRPGYIIRCLGFMKTVKIFRAIRITVLC